MPPLSKAKQEKISEQILHLLFTLSPEAKFTSDIAKEIARDEEFIKRLLLDLEKKRLVFQVRKNALGIDYKRRQRWRLSTEAYNIYKRHQMQQHNNIYNKENADE